MNWGHKITIVIIIFILGMLGMVFIAFKQTNEMVDANYYDKEIKYQTLIDAAKNFNEVSNLNLISQNKEGLNLSLPTALITNFSDGKIEFIKNDNEKDDRTFNFTPSLNGDFKIDNSKIELGTYKVRISWVNSKKLYYKEQNITVF